MKEDTGYYDYWPYRDRPRITWPKGARLAFWVAPISSSTNSTLPVIRNEHHGRIHIQPFQATRSVTTATESATRGR